MARVSLEQLRASRPQVERDKLDATTEADIRRHAIEDDQDPDAELSGYTLVPAPAEIRKKLGATQQVFAEALRVPVGTVRNWEQGRKVPDPAAVSLLTIFEREPEAAMRALKPQHGLTLVKTKQGFRVEARETLAVRKVARDNLMGRLAGTKAKATPVHRRSTPKPAKV